VATIHFSHNHLSFVSYEGPVQCREALAFEMGVGIKQSDFTALDWATMFAV
jgi:hypothetical protein